MPAPTQQVMLMVKPIVTERQFVTTTDVQAVAFSSTGLWQIVIGDGVLVSA